METLVLILVPVVVFLGSIVVMLLLRCARDASLIASLREVSTKQQSVMVKYLTATRTTEDIRKAIRKFHESTRPVPVVDQSEIYGDIPFVHNGVVL